MALGGVRLAEESETWPSFHTELPGSPVGSGAFCLLLLPVQSPVLLHVTSHLVALWKTVSLPLESKSQSHFQLVQVPTVLIRVREGASTPRAGQEGDTWTALETCPDVRHTPGRTEALEGRTAVCPMYYMMVVPRKVPAPCGPSCIFQE